MNCRPPLLFATATRPQQGPDKTNGRSGSQENLYLLWKLNVRYRLHKNRPLVPNLSQMYPAPATPHLNSLKLFSYSLTSFWVDSPFMIHNQNFVCISHLTQMCPLYPSLTLCPLRHNSYIIILSQVPFVSTFRQSFSKVTNMFDCLTSHCLLKVQDFVLNDAVVHAMKAGHISEVTSSFVLNLSTISRWVVSLKFRPLYPRRKRPLYPLKRRLGGLQGQSRRSAKEKTLWPLPWI